MKKILLALAVFATFIYTSCSSSDDSDGGSKKVTISADFTTTYVNENITFTATDGKGNNVTSDAVFYVNDVVIVGNVYTSATAGTFAVKAKYNGATSQMLSIIFNVMPAPLTSITVSSNMSSVEVGNMLIFKSIGNNGVDVTSTSTFYINGNPITGSSLITNAAGTLDVYATHMNSSGTTLTSSTIQVTVNQSLNFRKRVLIEDFTGTWCQYCPRVSRAIELVEEQTEYATVVAIHRNGGGGSDPYNFAAASALEDQINLAGYPTAMLNRTTEWASPETNNVSQVVNLTAGENPKLGIAMATTTSGSTSTVKVSVKFGKNFNGLKLVVYALENGLVYNQINSTTHFGGVNPIVGFVHDNVVRAVLTSSILGENIIGSTGFNDEFSKTFTYTIPSNVNAANVRFVALVIDGTKKALNSREVGKNETQTFEME